MKQRITGWGRYPVATGEERIGEDLEPLTREVALTRGLGRSYGDSSLPAADHEAVARSTLADRLLDFDETRAVLRAEAGVSLLELNRLLLPRGYFTPVTPGTQYVTLGGMVASDVHGKNHHVAGSFGEHVESLKMRVPDGRVLEINEENEPELFRATLGGMGLTGHVLEVQVRMQKVPTPWILGESERVGSLSSLISTLRRSSSDWPFTVAWFDCLKGEPGAGRGVIDRGRWAEPSEAPAAVPRPKRRFRVPFDFPEWVLSHPSVRLFNSAVYFKALVRSGRRIIHPETFFYPLDSILDWNRVYGKRGFTQYQCVLPDSGDPSACQDFFDFLQAKRAEVYLAVMKDCGAQGKGTLSFPMRGVSLALDIAMRGERTAELVDALNERVIELGGRVYMAKDALTRREHFVAMEKRLEAFDQVRRKWDPERRLRSAQSVRLLGDGE